MFEQRGGMLRNILTREVPRAGGRARAAACSTVLGDAELDARRHRARGSCMPADATCCSRSSSRSSSTRTQLALQRGDAARVRQPVAARSSTSCSRPRSRTRRAAGWWWMSSFGAGFSCHGALLRGGMSNALPVERDADALPRRVTPRPRRAASDDPRARALAPRPAPRQPVHGHARHLRSRAARSTPRPCARRCASLELGAGDGTPDAATSPAVSATAWPAVDLTLLDRQPMRRADDGRRVSRAAAGRAQVARRRRARLGSRAADDRAASRDRDSPTCSCIISRASELARAARRRSRRRAGRVRLPASRARASRARRQPSASARSAATP